MLIYKWISSRVGITHRHFTQLYTSSRSINTRGKSMGCGNGRMLAGASSRWLYNCHYFSSPWQGACSLNFASYILSTHGHKILLWDLTTDPCQQIPTRDVTGTIAFSLDGKWLASGSNDGNLQLWDTLTYMRLKELQGHRGPVTAIDFSTSGKVLASGSEDNTIRVWDTASGELLLTLEGHISSINTIAFSPTDQLLASGSDDETIRVWNATSGELLFTIVDNSGPVEKIAFSPSGQVLVSGSWDYSVR